MQATARAFRSHLAPSRGAGLAMPRVVWLAVAEARGHLMRALLAKQLLAEHGIVVDIVTTSPIGADFAATFGEIATVLPGKYRLHYDAAQNLERTRSRIAAVRYLAAGCARDLGELRRFARSASVIVNDSFHPALLVATLSDNELGRRVVHVHCENTRLAVEATGGYGPLALLVRRAMTRSRRIEIVLDGGADGVIGGELSRSDRSAVLLGEPDAGGCVRLPPLVAMPRPRAVVRTERGVRAHERLAVVYLNPYFHDARLAAAIERALADAGYRMHAVGEGFAGRPGWHARDARLADAVAAADLFISAPGAGAVTMARTFGVPMIAIATDQPEQRKNLATCGGIPVDVACPDDELRARLAGAIVAARSIPTPLDPDAAIERARSLWTQAFASLVTCSSPHERISP